MSTEAVHIGNPITAAADLRRVTLLAACLAVGGGVVMFLVGRPWTAVFAAIGMAIGLGNALLVRRSAARFAMSDTPSRGSFAMGAMGRLALVSAVALGFALLVQPDGIGVFVGLAGFHLLMIGAGLVPLLKELRNAEGNTKK